MSASAPGRAVDRGDEHVVEPRWMSLMTDVLSILRRIPQVDALIDRAIVYPACRGVSRALLVSELRGMLLEFRERVSAGDPTDAALFDGDLWLDRLGARLGRRFVRRHRPVINATGILLHTGLGRAPLSAAAVTAATEAGRYAIVEVSPETGERDFREESVAGLVCELTGGEAATVVNNNAAAIMLVLGALAAGREVICSRGELVEIGGGFRMPEVMTASGCILREVGATNRTYARDYEGAVGERSAMLMKVHTSNYRVLGFTCAPSNEELAVVARRHGLPFVYDLGAGLLRPIDVAPLGDEPTVRESLAAGCDIVTFSGDKLLCGPQAGVIVGKKDLIAKVRSHPLFRAMRPGKLDLAALEATLLAFVAEPEGLPDLPLYRALAQSESELRAAAEPLLRRAREAGADAEIVDTNGFMGSGSAPAREFPGIAVAVRHPRASAATLLRRLRIGDPTVFARIEDDSVRIEMRTVFEDQHEALARAVVLAMDDRAT